MTHPRSLQFGELFDKFKDMAFENHVFTVGLVHDLMWVHENNVDFRRRVGARPYVGT